MKKRLAAFTSAAVLALSAGASQLPMLSTAAVEEASVSASEAKTTEAFVTRMYSIVLGRTPDAAGLANWTQQLNNHTSTASDIVYGFFFSQEYLNKNKSSEEIVTDCYNAMLGRDPDSQGKENWVKRLDAGMTSQAIFRGFVGSSEFKELCAEYGIDTGSVALKYARDENYERTYFVYRLYANCLGRQPDTAGLENWCKNLRDGLTGTKIANGFIFSSEYKERNTADSEYVTMLYRTILGREPDSAGLSNWVDQLAIGRSREYIANGFLFSNEFKEQCTTAGIKLTAAPSSSDYNYGAAPKKYDIPGITYIGGMLIVNKSYSIPSDFNPGLDGTCQAQFNKLVNAAANEGLYVYLASGFRSYSYQSTLYNNYVSWNGQEKADTFSARPGYSEHQTGLAIDVNNVNDSFIGTAEAKWIEAHCHEYGFILRYPQGKQDITGYKYESWHIRYVGTDLAYKLKDSGLTVEEYFGVTSQYSQW